MLNLSEAALKDCPGSDIMRFGFGHTDSGLMIEPGKNAQWQTGKEIMMKSRNKKIVLFLIAALVFSLTACGTKDTTISVSGENVTIDDLALRPGGEAGILYENDGLKLMIPLEYDELLLKEIPQDDPNGILFSVTEKASADAAEASGEEYDGAG